MSFGSKTKTEITTLNCSKSEKIATLSGFIRNNGYFQNNNLYLTTENNDIAAMLESTLKLLYEINVTVTKKENINLFKTKLNLLEITEKIDFLLKDIGYYNKESKYLDTPPKYIVGANEEIRSYLRGVFLSSGSINDPSSSYHLEFTVINKEEAVFVQRLLNLFDLNAKILSREKGYMIYIKEAEKICDFLRLIQASNAVLYYENVRIYHEEKNKTNRLNNCEQANIDRVFFTASNQLKQIEIIENSLEYELLDDKIKDVMNYRKKYPEASLKELSEIISKKTGKSITKSGLNHRLRKIKELADSIKKNTNL